MKKLLLGLIFSIAALAQCSDSGNLFAANATSTPTANSGCTNWTFQVTTQLAVSSYTATMQGNFGSGYVTMASCSTVPKCTVTVIGQSPTTTRVILNAVNGGYIQFGYAGSIPTPPKNGTTINSVFCALNGSCTVASSSTPTPQFVQTQNLSITGTTSTTSLIGTGVGSVTLPANFFSAIGSILVIDWQGGVTTGTGGLTTIAMTIGGTTLKSGSSSFSASSAFNCHTHLTITALTVGASGSLLSNPQMICFNGTTFQPTWETATGTPIVVNTTGALAVGLTVSPAAANDVWHSNTLTMTGY